MRSRGIPYLPAVTKALAGFSTPTTAAILRTLEILHRSLVFLGGRSRRKRAKL